MLEADPSWDLVLILVILTWTKANSETNLASLFDPGGSVRMPAIFSGITSLKPTAGRIPLIGQGSDGGLVGVVGLHNTVGFMAKSASSIEVCMREIVGLDQLPGLAADPRLVQIPWREKVAKAGQQKLRIGW